MMRICEKGHDYFGYYIRVGIGKGEINIRFDTTGIDLVAGIFLSWKDGHCGISLFNFNITYFFEVDRD